jgi:hypothetical protein
MPSKGYATVGLKPSIINRLQDITDKNYPGMFLPSTLIIMMNEVKKGYYSVESHNIKLDLTGHYNTITIRSDIQEWLEKNQEKLGEEYEKKYRAKCFTKFVSYFIVNLLESKYEASNRSINLKESDFTYLQKEYQRQKEFSHEGLSFEKFVDDYINELFGKIKASKEILTI